MPNICPCCKRRIPALRKSSKPDKRLEEDIARAQVAIACLATAGIRRALKVVPHYESPTELHAFQEAVNSETLRLQSALIDHKLLWSIYRRKDKSTPYYETQDAS